ncbi:GNAT family N-acetyltransferase [Pseudochrobactrum sp. HB0163]|uniref:GNAT family N-acetyltransferase n=1 Tax=Pseudochrobactrum sp. HB0163 TaxID=3450708 RepID=UPI003F6DC4CF
MQDLSGWTARPLPERMVLEGRFVRLEPADAARHAEGLYEASAVPDIASRFTWLFDTPPASVDEMRRWLEKAAANPSALFFVIIDKATSKIGGRQALMRIDAENGSIEIGSVYWAPLIARKAAATEAQFLFMRYVFDTLGYRRYEWKCDNDNLPSKRAAERFGFKFEGIFRQHLIVKGKNRDTAWYSVIDSEWPVLKQAYEHWLAPDNFDRQGRQIRKLESFYR